MGESESVKILIIQSFELTKFVGSLVGALEKEEWGKVVRRFY